MDIISRTQQYYADNALAFSESTQSIDMTVLYESFMPYLSLSSTILDAGCGSGRDAKYFQLLGYKVSAFDASPELVKIASEYLGFDVSVDTFQTFNKVDSFDAIWCCASLLHVPKDQLSVAVARLHRALTAKGVLYMSFKYGDQERIKDDRYFSDQTEKTIIEYLDGFEICEVWVTNDQRTDHVSEQWLNVIIRKCVK